MIFEDRRAAGRALGALLTESARAWKDPVVIALPRGGVPVGFEVSRALGAALDILAVRKVGAPGQPELALGAVAGGAPPLVFLNEAVIREARPSPAYLDEEIARQTERLARFEADLRRGVPALPRAGRDIVLVDDGLATGATARAAVQRLREDSPRRLLLAVPVAPSDTLAAFRRLVDEAVCLQVPGDFRAVGDHYRDFGPVPDEEVYRLLRQSRLIFSALSK